MRNLLLLLAACTNAVIPTPDAGDSVQATCAVQVLQTIDGAASCAVTVTVEVSCIGAEVSSASVTAETDSLTLGEGVKTEPIAIGCGQTQRITFGGMPCAESATGIVRLNDGATCSLTQPQTDATPDCAPNCIIDPP